MTGLLVILAGFPLAYDVFAGNIFEGKTMLPVVEGFIARHPDTKPIVVADAAMLGAKAKFIKRVSKEKIELNTASIEKRRLLPGIKGYCTNLSESQLPAACFFAVY